MNVTNAASAAGAKKLLACDLDGTLIFDHGGVPARAMRALQNAHRAGWLVAISTGRSFDMLPGKLKRSRTVDAYIISNGARVILRGGKTLLLRPLPHGAALPVWTTLNERGAAANVFFDGKALFVRCAYKRMDAARKMPAFVRLGMLFRFLPHSRSERGIRRRICKHDTVIEKIGGVFPSEKAAGDACAQIAKLDGLTVLTTQGNDIEVTAGNASKGSALMQLCQYFGIDKQSTVVCGDSGNDLSMRAYCGVFVAPRNASRDVLAVADVLTDVVKKDGVAKWLLENLK